MMMNNRRSFLIGALLISVVLNLFLVGMLAGGMGMRHRHFGPMALTSPHGAYMEAWLTHYLKPEDAAVFHESFAAQSDALKTAHEHVHQATRDVATIFEREQPDPQALQTAFDHLSAAKSEANAAVEKIVTDSYPKLSPEGRRRLGELTQ